MLHQKILEAFLKGIAVAVKIGVGRRGEKAVILIHSQDAGQHFADAGIFHRIHMCAEFVFKCLPGNGQITGVGNKAHVLFGSCKPLDEHTGGIFFLFL